jgi:adenylate cyclase
VEGSVKLPTLLSSKDGELNYKELMEWLHSVMDVLQAAADSNDFFERAAHAVVDMVDLDTGRVVLYNNGEWQSQSVAMAPRLRGGQARDPSTRVLNKMLQDRRTVWEVPTGGAQVSLMNVEAVVAAPVMDRSGEVIGAVYGDRRSGVVPGMAAPISELEAMMVEMLARGVAAGLARVQQEKQALSHRVQFEQFFTKDLAERLARDPEWLKGRKAEVTVMFTDIRGFSRLTEKLNPDQAVKWTQAALDMLSDCVLSEGGVLVDFTGDGLMALWGAPGEQPDHPERACRAALTIMARLPVLNKEWESILGEPMKMGIGINTGMATVGNVGSQYKFKYGARGTTVNMGSRIEGVTKQFQCQLLVTKSTRDKLSDSFRTRRLGTVQVVNINEPVEVYELVAPDHHAWPAMKDEYEKALVYFENKDYPQVGGTLAPWRRLHPDDGPSLVLLYRAVRYMVEGTPGVHPVWVLGSK